MNKVNGNNVIKEFINNIKRCAPFISSYITPQILLKNNFKPITKYPYKPALIIAIFYNIPADKLFNQDIKLDDNNIVKTYYDLLMSSPTLCFYFRNQISKDEWYLGYNDKNKQIILNNMLENPVDKLRIAGSDFWTFNKKNKTIRINYHDKSFDPNLLRTMILNEAIDKLRNIIPEYNNLSINEIINYEYLVFQNEINLVSDEKQTTINSRRYQHLFAKIIKDRDQKCIVCNLTCPQILEACHIKPHHQCIYNEKYDFNNGLTMCATHHKLFDAGLFSFDREWNLMISSHLKNFKYDVEILFNEQKINKKLPMSKSFGNPYLKYHNEKVFRK